MKDHDVPDSFRDLALRLASDQREERRTRAARDRKEQLRAERRQEGRDRDRPAALAVMKWAALVAQSGVLDELGGHGLMLVKEGISGGQRTLSLKPDGSLSSHHHYAGGGATEIRSADELLLGVDMGIIEKLAAQIESGAIWQTLETLNEPESPRPLQRIQQRHRQFGPSCDLDEDGDPIPPRRITSYEIETDEPGYWEEIGEEEAMRLVDEGLAVLV